MPVDLAAERFPGGGDGTPLLIAHGLFGSGRNWGTLAKRFAEARPTATVDLRNHGSSPWVAAMDYVEMGADLAASARTLFDRPPLILGHSMGGKAAMAAALTAPDALAGVIVADIAPVAYDHTEHGVFVDAMQAADLSDAVKRSDVDPQLAEAIPEPSLRAFILANLAFETTAAGRRAAWRLNLEAIAAAMPALVGWPADLAAACYPGPAYFLHGGASDYVTPDGRAAILSAFPAAEIARLDGAGHWLHAEKPQAFFDAAAAWLDGR